MEPIINLLNTIVRDWGLLVAVFAAGGFYLQGKMWFQGVNKALEDAAKHQREHERQAAEILTELKDIRNDVKGMKGALDNVEKRNVAHELELTRNTEQHAAIVRALESHVSDNREHDQSVKASLAVLIDRLRIREH